MSFLGNCVIFEKTTLPLSALVSLHVKWESLRLKKPSHVFNAYEALEIVPDTGEVID